MEVEVAKPSGVQRSKEEIISILEECRKSKLKVKDFVRAKGIHEATYYNWRNKYGSEPVKQNTKAGFSSLKINPSGQLNTSALFAEVRGIKIYQPVAAVYLKELLG